MATQGLISITNKGKVLYKIVAGCNGSKIEALVKCVKNVSQIAAEKINAKYLYHIALDYKFGCKDCLVVFNEEELETDNKECFHGAFPLYLKTFNDPNFNPRWEQGIADYVEVVDLSKITLVGAV